MADEMSLEDLAQLGRTYQKVLEHPETRDVALRATKKATGISVPETDLKDMALAEFRKRDEKIASLENGIRERDARDRIERERTALRNDGFDADDVSAIEKVMMDEHIPSYATAAKYYRNARQVATPTPATGEMRTSATYDLPQEALASMKNGKQGLNKFSRGLAEQAVDELKSGRVKLH